jgi:hypothetical protein
VCAAYVLLGIALALPGVPLYSYLDPAHKPLVVCVGTGIVLAFTLSRLVRSVRQHLEAQPASDFAAAARPWQEVTHHAPPLVHWQQQVTYSRRRRTYFAHVLRPRLLALGEDTVQAHAASGRRDVAALCVDDGTPGPLTVLLDEPRRRFSLRRGVPWRTLQALVTALEEL